MKRVFIYGEKKILKNYEIAVRIAGAIPVISKNITFSNDCDCLLLAGGGDVFPSFYGKEEISCFDKDFYRDLREFSLINVFSQKSAPIFGICRGLQVINVYFGGTLCQKLKNADMHYSPLKDCYHSITIKKSGEFPNLLSDLNVVNSAHRQAIEKIANGFEAVAVSDDECIEAIQCTNKKIFACQFHPERLPQNLYKIGIDIIKFGLNL